MKIEQGTQAWEEWRSKGIGASELPAIMGESEYDTPRSLWMVRTGRAPKKENNYAMTLGQEFEAKARAIYELQTGNDCPPELFECFDLQWARCSLDGWNADKNLILEIKVMGKEKHQMVRDGKVPDTYRAQLQWQLFVTGAKVLHFVSLEPELKDSIEIVAVTPDPEYWAIMIPKAMEFWEFIQTDTPPPLTSDDYLEEADDVTAQCIEEWKRAKFMVMQVEDILKESLDELAITHLKVKLKEETERLNAAKANLQSVMKHPKLKANGVRVITRKGKNGASLDIRFNEVKEAV